MRKSILALLALALVLALGGSAFAAKDSLVVADQYDATMFDPVRHNDYPSSRACHQVYDTLIFLNDDGTFRPGLAEKWEFVSDTAYKMYLRKGVKFHNGEDLKAEDVKFSLERATTEVGAHIKTYSQDLDNVEIVDDYTVILHLKKVNFPFFASLAHSWGSIVNKKEVEAQGENYGTPAGTAVGTGPFKFVSWQKSDRYTLERFDDYWDEKAKFKTLVLRSIPEPTARTVGLETGEVDIAYPMINNDISRIEENEALVLQRKPLASTTYMGFNTQTPPFDNPEVRKAITIAIDREAALDVVYQGLGRVPTSPLLPINNYFPEPVPVEYDPDKAKEMLDKAGVKDLAFTIYTNENKQRKDYAEVIQNMLSELDIKVEIQVLEWGTFLDQLKAGKLPVFMIGWSASDINPDPDAYIKAAMHSKFAGPSNRVWLKDAEVDELLDKGTVTPDGPERAEIYKRFCDRVNELNPWCYLAIADTLYGTNKALKGADNFYRGIINRLDGVYYE